MLWNKTKLFNLIDEYSERKTLNLKLHDFKGEDSYFEENKASQNIEISKIIQKVTKSSKRVSQT